MSVLASGPRNARIAIVGMAPAADEVRTGIPFMGAAGEVLNRAISKLGYKRTDIYVTNVHDAYLSPGSSLFSLPAHVLAHSTSRLQRELAEVKPNVIVPLGDEPLRIICNLNGITKWRGSIVPATLLPGTKCVPSVHPAWIVRGMWKWEPVFTHIDLARAFAESTTPEINLPRRNAIIGPSYRDILDYIEECARHDLLSVDIEVYGYSKTGTGEIACVGIGFDPHEALCIPLTHLGGQPVWTVYEECQIWRALARLLEAPHIRKVGQNLAFEWIYFWLHHIYPANMWIDTMLLHHTLYPDWGGAEDIWGRKRTNDEPGHSLAFINSQYTKTPYYKDDGRRWNPKVGEHDFWVYNCKDVMCTLDAALKMKTEADDESLWQLYIDYKQKPFMSTCRAEWFGVSIDLDRRAEASRELGETIRTLQDRINQKLGYKLNVNSPKQMQQLLYKEMKFGEARNRKTGRVTTDKGTIRKFAEQSQDEVLLWIQELRHTIDLKSDIVDQPLGPDNRMHTHFKLSGTDTGRWSSTRGILGTGTNLQNIPVKGIARSLFIP